MTRLAVIADDLTGALDATAPFAIRGMRVVVAVELEGLPEALSGNPDVVGISTDSRYKPAAAARNAVAAVLRALPGSVKVFKKIDSRLKGNIAAELDAIPYRYALVVPAIPAFARVVRGGTLCGFGVDEPIDVMMLLGHHAERAVVPDVETDRDIEAALERADYDLPVGARGLAEALAKRMVPLVRPTEMPTATGAVYVIGSTDPVTLEQVARLREGHPGLAYYAAPGGRVSGSRLSPGAAALVQAIPEEGFSAPSAVARRLAEGLVRLGPGQGSLIVASGGATAQAVFSALGVRTVDLLGEALPGLPIARARGFTLITKSGGFGQADALLRLSSHLPIRSSEGS
jgi:uncharacterized protein YgbK (DUF1537 family)